jgi:hypothetical protein
VDALHRKISCFAGKFLNPGRLTPMRDART